MTRFRLFPYRNGSRSARALREALPNCMEIKREGSRYRPRADDVIINWGASDMPEYPQGRVLNLSSSLLPATNKLHFFRKTREEGIANYVPDWWERMEDIPDDAFPVVCRTVLTGHSGAGIVIAANRQELVRAPLYTRYVKKSEEYRLHIGLDCNDENIPYVFSQQKKVRRHDVDNPNWQVRNHHNGFVYARNGLETPVPVVTAALAVFSCFDLDFGAVDVIYNRHYDRAYVLEINTAPGLEGESVEHYRQYFEENY